MTSKKKDQDARIEVRGGGLGDSGNARKKTFFFIEAFPKPHNNNTKKVLCSLKILYELLFIKPDIPPATEQLVSFFEGAKRNTDCTEIKYLYSWCFSKKIFFLIEMLPTKVKAHNQVKELNDRACCAFGKFFCFEWITYKIGWSLFLLLFGASDGR